MNARTSLFFTALALTACDPAPTPSDAPRQASIGAAQPGAGPAFTLGDDWRASVDEAVANLRADDSPLADKLYGLQPRTTRAGTLRLTGPLVRRPIAAAVFLDRLASGVESATARAALVEALPRTTGPFGAALIDLMEGEADAHVRSVMVASLRTADAPSALEGLSRGLQDADPRVRATAAKTVARRRDGEELASALLEAAADGSASVEVEAMRSLGALRIDEARDVLETSLASADADHRLAAVRALSRIDPSGAASLPAIQALTGDADPRVARAATSVVAP